jgi:hypothetical protein
MKSSIVTFPRLLGRWSGIRMTLSAVSLLCGVKDTRGVGVPRPSTLAAPHHRRRPHPLAQQRWCNICNRSVVRTTSVVKIVRDFVSVVVSVKVLPFVLVRRDVTRDAERCVTSCFPESTDQWCSLSESRECFRPIGSSARCTRWNNSDKRRKSFINSRHFACLRTR